MGRWAKVYIKTTRTRYSVSDCGNIRNDDTGKLLKTTRDKKGYYRVCLTHNGNKVTKKMHRLIRDAFNVIHCDVPGIDVHHKDTNKDNNTLDNLEYINHIDHLVLSHTHRDYNMLKGEDNPTSKFTEAQIKEVCMYLEQDRARQEIAGLTGVSEDVVFSIKAKRTWKHISKDYNIPDPIQFRYPQELRDSIKNFLSLGHTPKEIISLTGLENIPAHISLIHNIKYLHM